MSPADIIATDNAPRPVWHLYRSLVGVGIASALLIAAAFVATAPIIEANRAAALERAVLQVVPGAERFVRHDLEQPVYAAYDADDRLVGLALEAQAMGYQDTVRILYGYDPERQAVVGMQVLESRETPGLGDRIETDPDFRANFTALDVSLDDGGDALAHPIELVKPGARTRPWQIDSISGATISSEAVAVMLRDSTAHWVPRLHRRRAEFATPAEGRDER